MKCILVTMSLLCATLGSTVGARAEELYGWSISASDTDPFENVATPQTGLFSLYIWVTCIQSEVLNVGGFGFEGSLADAIVGVVALPGFGVVQTSDPLEIGIAADCTTDAPAPTAEVFVFDGTGKGGTLCLVGTSMPASQSCNCDAPFPMCFENAVTGFSSDGSDPCVVGSCTPPISVDASTWGSLKALYR